MLHLVSGLQSPLLASACQPASQPAAQVCALPRHSLSFSRPAPPAPFQQHKAALPGACRMQPSLIHALCVLTMVLLSRCSPPIAMSSEASQQQPQQQQPASMEDLHLQQFNYIQQQYEQQMSAMRQENLHLKSLISVQQAAQQQQMAAASSSSSPSPQPGANATHLPRIDLKPLQPSAFQGVGNNADQWLSEVERYFTVAGLGEGDSRRVLIASTYLKDLASGWYTSMAGEFGSHPTWANFRAKFLERFRPIAASRVARAALRNLKHRHKVAGYTQEFQKHMQHIHDMSVTDQIETYLAGLQQHLAAEVDREQPQTLAAAMEIAQRVELLLATRRSGPTYGPPRRGGFVPYRSGGSDRSEAMDLSAALQQTHDDTDGTHLSEGDQQANVMSFRGRGGRGGGSGGRGGRGGGASRFAQQLSPDELEKLYKEGRCFRCKEQGHSARFCDKKSTN